MVGLEVKSGKRVELFGDALLDATTCPYSVAADSLVVAYKATAELGCHLRLGWPPPENTLDLYPEFRCLTNDLKLPKGSGLRGALHHYHLSTMVTLKKEAIRSLADRGGPWTESERSDLLECCGDEADALVRLLAKMIPSLDLPHALERGRFMTAVARMERTGVPVDVGLVRRIRTNWTSIRRQFIEDVDADYGVYVGTRFSQEGFRRWLEREGINWPILNTKNGSLQLDRKTFKRMAQRYPQVEPLRSLRQMLSQLRSLALSIGADGYSRTSLSPFRAKTSRNQPSSTEFIFGLSSWARQLLCPAPGNALAYLDWKQQEFGIAAALSGDTAMMDAYRTGDPYLAFAKQAGAVPADATGETHAARREQFKQCALAVLYGMGVRSLAERLGISATEAQGLLTMHRKTYRKFWRWSDAVLDYAHFYGELHSTFGWRIRVTPDTSNRTLRNFPMQTNGAEMLRLACCMLTERGIRVCAPIHDAVLVEAPVTDIDAVVAKAQGIMAEASAIVLGGFALHTDKKEITKSGSWEDSKGKEVWEKLMNRLPPPYTPDVDDDRETGFDNPSTVASTCEPVAGEDDCHE